jgi:hypothetical protein
MGTLDIDDAEPTEGKACPSWGALATLPYVRGDMLMLDIIDPICKLVHMS